MSELDRWQARYAGPGYLFGTEPNAFLKSKAHLLKPGWKALAVADGEGRNGVWLAGQGLDVLSIDFSPTAIAKAKVLASDRRVALRTEVVDLAAWQWPSEAFDVIAAIFIQFAGPAMRPAVFAGIKHALRPGGLLLMQGYRPEQLVYKTGGPSDPAHLWTRRLLEDNFRDMSSVEIVEHDSIISEGTHHVGMSALIDFVGHK